MRKYWIVVADAGRALVFGKTAGNAAPMLLHEIENPAGRMRTGELVSDEEGRVSKMRGGAKSGMEARTDPHEQKAIDFAREMGRMLEAATHGHEFDWLILVAPGHFLGLLNSQLGAETKKRLAMSHTKDLTHASGPDLEAHVRQFVEQAPVEAR